MQLLFPCKLRVRIRSQFPSYGSVWLLHRAGCNMRSRERPCNCTADSHTSLLDRYPWAFLPLRYFDFVSASLAAMNQGNTVYTLRSFGCLPAIAHSFGQFCSSGWKGGCCGVASAAGLRGT